MQTDAAFDTFVRTRSRALLRTAHLLTGDLGHAEDLLQMTFERVARRWRGLHEEPEGYARRVLANLAIDGWRRRSVRPHETASWLPELTAAPDAHDRVEQQIDLIRALMALTPRQRAVLVLRYFDDLTEAQTADALGITVGTVKSTASKALTNLRTTTALPEKTTPRS